MATLQSIRNKGVLLAVIIGLALLAFIIGDFLNSGSTLFHQNRQTVADVNGEKINIQTYQDAIEQMNTIYKIESGRTDFNENEQSQIRNQVWENMINERILVAETKKIGLTVGKEELRDRLIGNNIHPMISQRPAFVDPQTGQFSKNALIQFYNSIFDSNVPQESQEQLRDAKNYWLFWENNVKNAVLQDKYFALIGKSVGANSIDAKYNYDARKMTGDVNYVVQPYSAIADSAVQVSDSEIKTLYEKKKEQYKQEANRSINYVSFNVEPQQEDFLEAEEWMKKMSEEFKTTNDIIGLVNSESDVTYDDRQSYSRQTVPAYLQNFAFSNSTGAIFGPMFQNNMHVMAKIMESGIMESDSVKLRHIVLAPTDEKRADSLVNVIRSGANFGDAARQYSLAQQTANAGGEVGWITRSMVGKEISDPAFSKGVNELFKVSNTQGIQIFQIMEKTPARPKVKLAILERKVEPSNQTYSKLYNEAKQFAAATNNQKEFDDLAKEKGYVVRPSLGLTKNSDNVDMIPQSRQVVRWAFENNKGKVSDVFDCDRTTYIVATVSEINEKGYRTVEQVIPQLKAEIIKDKKADLLKKQLTDQLAQNPSLEGLALFIGTEIKTAPAVNFTSSQFGDAGPEPAIIGKASVAPAGQITVPLQGQSGVYVLVPLAKQTDTTPFDAKLEVAQLDYRATQSLPYTIMQNMREKYNITDNRFNFY
ncbi:MAG: SurA N-terminal domain-containing protein [Paludibacteraceae bacterium]